MAENIPDAVRTAARTLRGELHRGAFPDGSRLPGERALSERLGISRTTLRKALQVLADEQWLTASPQRGWFVNPVRMVSEPTSSLISFSDHARERGLTPTARVLHQGVRPASFEEAGRLGCAPGARLVEIRRLRGLEDQPVAVEHNLVPYASAPALAETDLTDRSLYATLSEDFGIAVVRSDFTVWAARATPDVAPLLELDEGAPVLIGDSVTFTEHGEPILLAQTSYRGDAYRFNATLMKDR